MTLSRMDEEESPLKLSDFAVSEAVEETAESFRDFARSQGHPLEFAIVPGLTYCGDEYAVRQLVSILLDNAVKYALPETPIRFVLEKGKPGVVLRCSNACTPLAEGETEKLFDRFYRSDQARSADGSFGVGLSIARSIAEGHHGFIRAPMPSAGGDRVHGAAAVKLPKKQGSCGWPQGPFAIPGNGMQKIPEKMTVFDKKGLALCPYKW